MNHLLYNISVVMLLSGIIILTYYLSKTYNQPKCQQLLQQQQILLQKQQEEYDYYQPNIEKTYTMRPAQIFNNMFSKPDIWQGYESVSVMKNENKY
jgi:hypothetical protein